MSAVDGPVTSPRLSLNQATVKYASLAGAVDAARSAGIEAIGTWRESVAEVGLATAARTIADSALRVSSHCRGGFLTGPDRGAALEENRRAIEETATLAAAGAPGSRAVLVLVVGGLASLAPFAADAGVQLAIEPLHPMYAADRAVVSTLAEALDLAAPHDPDVVGVVVDTFHVWWDPALPESIARAGREHRIASYQVCDWLVPIAADPLLSRGVMGDGVIDFTPVTAAVDAAGYDGDIEVEIFNQAVWDGDPVAVAARVAAAFDAHVARPVVAP
jgi:sugar phosphate isomerase/epimerase